MCTDYFRGYMIGKGEHMYDYFIAFYQYEMNATIFFFSHLKMLKCYGSTL